MNYQEIYTHTEAFLRRLHPRMSATAVVHLVAMRKATKGHRVEWLWAPGQPGLANTLNLNLQGWDCFVAVNPCLTLAGRKKENIAYAQTLVVDVDTKANGIRLDTSVHHWRELGFEPSLIVESGNGGHIYFQLRDPVLTAAAERQGQRMSVFGHTDKVWNCDRIMRLPGTRNWKDPHNPKWCRWIYDSGRTYSLAEITHLLDRAGVPALDEPPPVAITLAPVPATARDAVERLPMRIRALVETGDTAGFPSNSEADFAVMHALVTAGCTDEQVEAVYAGYAIRGAKVAKAPRHYFLRTLSQARELAVAEAIAREEQANVPKPPFVQTGPGRVAIRMIDEYSARHFYDGI